MPACANRARPLRKRIWRGPTSAWHTEWVRFVGGRGLLVALALGIAPAPAFGQEDAAELTKAGLAKLTKGDLEGGVEALVRAAAIDPTAPMLFNLAQAEIKLGRLADAERHLKEAEVLAEQQGPKNLAKLSAKARAQITDRVPTLEIASVPDAERLELSLDGKRVKGVEHRINPGAHELVATADGYEEHREKFDVGEGKTFSLRFRMTRLKPAAPVKAAPPPKAEPTKLPLGPIVLGGAGVLMAGAGVYFYTRVSSIDDERIAAYEAAGCPGPNCPQEPESARLKREDAEQAALFGNVLVGVGAAAVVGAGVWWALASGSSEKEPSVALSLSPGAAHLRGRF